MDIDKEEQENKKKLEEALEQFEEQFNCELQATGYSHTAEENGGIREEEFWVFPKNPEENNTLLNRLNLDIGGWFSYDTRDDGSIYTLLDIQIRGDSINKTKGIQAYYNPDKEKWENVEYRTF